jgi:S1-C subfamily serine protease
VSTPGLRIARACAVAFVVSQLALGGCRRVDDPNPTPAPRRAPTPAPVTEAPVVPFGTTVVVPDFAKVAADVGPSVVTVISTVASRRAEGGTVKGLGSGLIVSARGQVLTNEHVVAKASAVEIELANLNRLDATVIYADPLLDLALLEVAGLEGTVAPIEFEARAPTPGQWVMAVGQPFGLGHTVTVGVISGLNRDYVDLGRPPGLRDDGIWSFIQTDASINIGNSGGPLVDADGRVVGITTAVRADGQGLAFAIPSAMARRFLEEVWTYGRVRHTRLGIKADNVDGAPVGRGTAVRVTEVDPTGPGAKAELEVGDLILAIEDAPVTRVSDVAYVTQLLGVGAKLRFSIKRGDEAARQVVVIAASAT